MVRFTLLLLLITLTSCSLSNSIPRIEDGEIDGIEGWNVHATINCEPNSGHTGTPVTVTIYFDQGYALVHDVETWQAIEDWGWEFKRTPEVDPEKEDAYTWITGYGLFLSGKAGILRYYAVNGGTKIAYGDIDVNGGKQGSKSSSNLFY